MEEHVKKLVGLDNTYNPNYLNRCKDSNLGLSKNFEDEAIKAFGIVPMWLNIVPTVFADNLWKK